ncbi:MAG: hypothetical protein OEQ53_09225 [Saprospiraceae bacterium]|nr:hypothetical protein [Saprospiraceae bacterium]
MIRSDAAFIVLFSGAIYTEITSANRNYDVETNALLFTSTSLHADRILPYKL